MYRLQSDMQCTHLAKARNARVRAKITGFFLVHFAIFLPIFLEPVVFRTCTSHAYKFIQWFFIKKQKHKTYLRRQDILYSGAIRDTDIRRARERNQICSFVVHFTKQEDCFFVQHTSYSKKKRVSRYAKCIPIF